MKYLLTFVLIFLPLQTFAQFIEVQEEKAVITLSPEIPAPKEMVTAKVSSSFYEDLKKATIIWSVDGVEKKREVGATTFQFQAPEAGKNMELFATVDRGGIVFAGFTNIQPSNIDIIYEANTYTPPFYKGRSVFTPQSIIRVAAIGNIFENGVKLPKNKIYYSWYKNDERVPELSGVGKDSAIFEGDLFSRDFSVSVIAESINSELKAKKKIIISPKTPKVVLYENNPLFGSIFEKSLSGTFNFDREEVGITAVPYFFSTDSRDSSGLQYKWYENGKEIGDGAFGSFINYLNPNKEKNGVANLGVYIENTNRFLQSGQDNFKINVLGNQQSDTMETNESIAF